MREDVQKRQPRRVQDQNGISVKTAETAAITGNIEAIQRFANPPTTHALIDAPLFAVSGRSRDLEWKSRGLPGFFRPAKGHNQYCLARMGQNYNTRAAHRCKPAYYSVQFTRSLCKKYFPKLLNDEANWLKANDEFAY